MPSSVIPGRHRQVASPESIASEPDGFRVRARAGPGMTPAYLVAQPAGHRHAFIERSQCACGGSPRTVVKRDYLSSSVQA
jgi:hypothetical protein